MSQVLSNTRRRVVEAQRPGHNRGVSWYTKGTMRGGVPRMYYGWMKPGSFTRRRFEKHRNPFVDLETGTNIYYRDFRDPPEAIAADADSRLGLKGMDNAIDLYNEYKIVPDLYPEGFQWKHKLNSEYNQWRSNTWVTPELIPPEHRGRFLCNFQVNVGEYSMKVAKFSPKDHRQWIYCVLYVGTGKGLAGWGRAVAPSTTEAKREAIKVAFGDLIGVDLENEGPMYPIRINVEGMKVMLYPSKRLVANFVAADIMCAFGVLNAGVKLHYRTGNAAKKSTTRIYSSVFELMRRMRSVTEVAHMRGKVPHSLISNMFPYLEELRRRKGMMAMHPKGKDGALMPDRVVDNRMPDHLKKGYYDDVYWKDFFAGSREQLNEPRLGLRGDELRAQLVRPVLVPMQQQLLQQQYQQQGQQQGGGRQRNNARGSGKDAAGGRGQQQQQRGGPGQRRTLQDVLTKLGKGPSDLGPIQVVNALLDKKLPTHMKSTFHLH